MMLASGQLLLSKLVLDLRIQVRERVHCNGVSERDKVRKPELQLRARAK